MQGHGAAFAVPIKNWKDIDEIAGILKKRGDVYRIANLVNDSSAPEKMRLVLVKGELDIMPRTKDVSLMDGKVFMTQQRL